MSFKPFTLMLLATATTLPAQAVIIEGTFKGIIEQSWDNGFINNAPNPYYLSVWGKDLAGQILTGTFSFDTDTVPQNRGTTGQVLASPTNQWLELIFNIDGKEYDLSKIADGFTPDQSHETLFIADDAGFTGMRDYTEESFGLLKSTNSANGNQTYAVTGGVSLLDSVLPLLNPAGLEQQFTWIDNNFIYDNLDHTPGLATFIVSAELGQTDSYAALVAFISEVSMHAKGPTTVPEPTTLSLFALAICLLAWRHRKQHNSTDRQ